MEEISFEQFLNVNERIGKMMICGLEGAGKTLLSAAIAVYKMLHGMEDCWESYRKIDEYNSLGYNFSKNFEHLVFANFGINCSGTKIPSFESYRLNPFRIGLYSEDYQTDFFPPGATFFITEAHRPFNAYMWDYVRPEVSAFWETSRQASMNLVIDTNRPRQVVNTIRELCNRLLFLEKPVENIMKGNVCIGHRLFILEFFSWQALDDYLKTGRRNNFREYILRLDKCFHENYDSFLCRMMHLKRRMESDFSVEHFIKICNVSDVENFSDDFGFYVPPGYFRKKSSEVKQRESPSANDINELNAVAF